MSPFTGLDYWSGILDWTTGLSYFSFLCTSEQVLPFYLDCQWLMHNIICQQLIVVTVHVVYLLHVYLKAATSIVLLGHFFLTAPSVVVQALPLYIPCSGYVDNWVLIIDIIGLLNYKMAFALTIAKVGQRMANMMHQCDDTFAIWISKF